MRSIALKIGVDENDPGGPGPVYPDGSFVYVPAPEPDKTVEGPTYRQLGLAEHVPADAVDRVAEINPEFPSLSAGERCTYAEVASEESHRIQSLEAGDIVFFYARLKYHGRTVPESPSIDTDSGYYLIGQFTLARDPLSVDGPWNIPRTVWQAFARNAHRKRSSFDARVLAVGDAVQSGLYRRVLPLDGPNLCLNDCLPPELGKAVARQEWGERPISFDSDVTEHFLRVTAGGRPRLVV